MASWLSLVSFTSVMLRMTVVISSSSAPNKTASPSEKMHKEDLSDTEAKEITSVREEKWNLSLYTSTVVRCLGRIFLKVLFIKMNNKTKDQIQS